MNKYPSIKQAFQILGFIIFVTILIAVPLNLLKSILNLSDSLVNLISYSIPILIASTRYLKRRKIANQDDYLIKQEKISISILLSLIAFLLLIIIFTDPINNLIPVPDWFNDLMIKVVSKDIFSFISVVIFAPIFEELILRGVILDGFLKSYNPRKAILLSALAFGLFHLNPWQFVPAFIGGLYLGWIYYRTQSIIPCIVIHSINNLIAFLMLSYDPNFTLTKFFDGSMMTYFFIILISITLFTVGIRVLNEKIKCTYNSKMPGNPGFGASLKEN
jgi:hypothetical protein